MPVGTSVSLAGEELWLRGDRCVFWPRAEVLFVADIHLGKSASFRSGGMAIPEGETEIALRSLTHALEETRARHLIVLGDLWHAAAGRTATVVEPFLAWRQRHAEVQMTLVEGNHDLRSGRLETAWRMSQVPEGTVLGPFCLCHYPQDSDRGYVLSGHLHPAATLEGRGRQSLSLPCFWVRPGQMVLPAFGPLTGCATIQPCESDRVYLVAENRVLEVLRTERAGSFGR